jgi:hypothetical protein
MRILILAVGFIAVALPAWAQTIGLAEVKSHVGQQVTVEAAVSDVHTGRSGITFIDLGGHYPDNAFVAVIFADDVAKFPNASALEGKTVRYQRAGAALSRPARDRLEVGGSAQSEIGAGWEKRDEPRAIGFRVS